MRGLFFVYVFFVLLLKSSPLYDYTTITTICLSPFPYLKGKKDQEVPGSNLGAPSKK